MKYILVIGDGMADDPVPELGGKTPLQYADIKTLDKLAGAGVLGNVKTIPDGMPAGSDTAILSIFGYDPRNSYSGRAPLEAAAMDITLSPGDTAYRCNMITIEDGDKPFEEKKLLSHSAGAIGGEESDFLLSELLQNPEFKSIAENAGLIIYPGSSFRHIAVQNISNTNELILFPPHDHINEELGKYLPNDVVLEKLIRLSFDILDDHPVNKKRRAEGKLPANCIWFWASGSAARLPDFTGKYGKTGSVISAVPLCQGIGKLIGLKKVIVEGATGELHTNYEGKVDAAMEALKTRDFVAIHIEAPDECTHNGDLNGKLQAIEWVDSRIVAPLISRLNETGTDFRMLLMSDHKTLTSTRAHDSTPVPYIIYDSSTDNKTAKTFNEQDASTANFIANGTDLMEILFK